MYYLIKDPQSATSDFTQNRKLFADQISERLVIRIETILGYTFRHKLRGSRTPIHDENNANGDSSSSEDGTQS